RFASALRCDDFCKHLHVVNLDRPALEGLAPTVETLATAEGLITHADSVRLRVGPSDSVRLRVGPSDSVRLRVAPGGAP
ncbi:MAG: histidinol dehydrogenase, partial [Acidimicrobiales bacterium]